METSNRLQGMVYGFCLIGAPLLMTTGTFFWQGMNVGITAGTLQVYACTLWISALLGLFGLLRRSYPRFAVLGAFVAVYACIGGNNFGMDGIYTEAFRLAGSDVSQEALWNAMGAAMPLTLRMPGLLFPLAILAVGVALLRAKVIPAWCAVMICLGAVAFPLSRIPRIEAIAHAADFLLLIPLVWIGWRFLRNELPATTVDPELRLSTSS